jgi:NADH:ubiquinone reductase (non-electrogenic)
LLTGVGLTGWLAYNIYTISHPVEQVEPDPDKKTLVVLGML